MTPPRLVVAGTVGAGKSTFVHTASAGSAIHTERLATDSTAQIKTTTTVAIDFAQISLGNRQVCQVYGLPGQDRFDFMRDMVMPTASACLVLIAAHRPDTFPSTQALLNSLQQRERQAHQRQGALRLILGLTHTDCPAALTAEHIRAKLNLTTDTASLPILTVDPRCSISVRQVLTAIVELVI
ncbi:GTPase [Nodosilinea sp. LEGE 07298]|uniref:GTP-binding protein n=1 Tax=Nodosilinea sp. LEGE 07298 TaxID=2777970 RepID=UPI001880A1EE|nr:GTPase [Nodosilinea sp. LEGE 07298]MBE9112861.1 GTPase [Nodosilinea sp. LEGE 07298]